MDLRKVLYLYQFGGISLARKKIIDKIIGKTRGQVPYLTFPGDGSWLTVTM